MDRESNLEMQNIKSPFSAVVPGSREPLLPSSCTHCALPQNHACSSRRGAPQTSWLPSLSAARSCCWSLPPRLPIPHLTNTSTLVPLKHSTMLGITACLLTCVGELLKQCRKEAPLSCVYEPGTSFASTWPTTYLAKPTTSAAPGCFLKDASAKI